MYIDIGNRREVLWDDYLIEKGSTTAVLRVHKPLSKELVYVFDKPWEESGVSYPHFIKLGDEYYMYYIAVFPSKAEIKQDVKDFNKEAFPVNKAVCLMKGKDPMKLERVNAGLFEIEGSTDNNIILLRNRTGSLEEEFDNFFVFVDDKPDCPPEEKIKAIGQMVNHDKGFPGFRELWSFVSSDGIHFKRHLKISGGDDLHAGLFDSLNTCFYDVESGVYKMFVRGLHLDWGIAAEAQKTGYMTEDMEKDLAGYGIRDIRYMESKDFVTWSVPERLSYSDGCDFQLYTNNIQKYKRAPHMYIGMPTRYTERKEWNMNYEQLGGAVNLSMRKERMKLKPRFALAVTDNIFMCSRDGLNWKRFPDTFIGAEAENSYNWRYGDAYINYNLIETACSVPGGAPVLSALVLGRDENNKRLLRRYELRQDGFASYGTDYNQAEVTTKPFVFEGTELSINFEASPAGFLYVDILDEWSSPIDGYHSCELFGNAIDRTVYFGESKDVSKLSGKPIRLKFTMRSAEIYSFIFK
ncbi:MAG: hypothetical protein ACI4QW_03000 [Clostridia bacterium]